MRLSAWRHGLRLPRSAMRRTLLSVLLLVACRKEPALGAGAVPDASVDVPASDSGSRGMPEVLAARCHATEQGVLLDGRGLDDLDVGDGLQYADGYAVGLVHHTQAGRQAAVVLLHGDASGARVVDLGPTLGDAPAPRLALCRKTLVAAAFQLPDAGARGGGSDGSRSLALYVVEPRVPEHAILTIPQRRDDSLAFDLACSGGAGLAVWDETTAAAPRIAARGVVRAAAFDVGQRAALPRDVSPPESDAEMPRVVSNGTGFFVLWLARRPEAATALDALEASTDIEATGEVRAYGWLEMIAVDAAGNATGPVRRLTSSSGHVSSYDLLVRLDQPQPGILVVARDDGEAVDGAGGALLRVRARGDGAEPPVALPTDGLGRGAPMLVSAPAPWLAWVGPREQLRLQPLDITGEIVAVASAEEGLDEARPLLLLAAGPHGPRPPSLATPPASPGGTSNPGARMLVAAPRDKAAQLRVFTCQD
jgi:hypothetical protein